MARSLPSGLGVVPLGSEGGLLGSLVVEVDWEVVVELVDDELLEVHSSSGDSVSNWRPYRHLLPLLSCSTELMYGRILSSRKTLESSYQGFSSSTWSPSPSKLSVRF